MALKEKMYMVVDTHMDMIYTIVDRLCDAQAVCAAANHADDSRYHHYVVQSCTRAYGEMWLQAWRDLL